MEHKFTGRTAFKIYKVGEKELLVLQLEAFDEVTNQDGTTSQVIYFTDAHPTNIDPNLIINLVK